MKGVSLIICTFNGAKLLRASIPHILRQQVPEGIAWEVLFIDNASTDNTAQVILSQWDSEIPMKVIREDEKGLIYARLRGIAEAGYGYISFIDDDNWIAPDWIREVYDFFEAHPGAGMVGSRNEAVFETSPPEWFREIQGNFAIGSQGLRTEDVTEERGYIWGAGMSLRKSAFERIREAGFKPVLVGRKGRSLLAGEDTEICFAFRLAGWQIWYNDSMQLQHYIPASRLEPGYLKRMYRGFGQSRALFPVYKAVLKNKKYKPLKLCLRSFRQFLPYMAWKATHLFTGKHATIQGLRYELQKQKMNSSLRNIFIYKEIYHRLQVLKQNMEVPEKAGEIKKSRP
jgi:glycosyltransferase involved in cell wall biosynthesis